MVRVPGFTHPVEDFYLENVLQLTGYQEVAVQQLGGLTGGTGPGGSGGGSGKGAAGKLPAAERRQIEAAIEAAFTQGSGGRVVRSICLLFVGRCLMHARQLRQLGQAYPKPQPLHSTPPWHHRSLPPQTRRLSSCWR